MNNIEELTVDGYVFANKQDAELAKNEIKKIAYIESHIDMSNMNMVKSIYAQAIENRTFQTPIGIEYLRDLQKAIEESKDEAIVNPIPLYTTFKRITLNDDGKVKERVTKAQKTELGLRAKYRNAVLISIILAVLVVAMFFINMYGTTPNILNYKTAVINQYSEWEQNLRERETIVRNKERELNINN